MERKMKKILLAVSILVTMKVVFGLPSLVMAQRVIDDCGDINVCMDDSCVSGSCVNTPDLANDASSNLGSGSGCSARELIPF
jgi:hypothetical protein